MGWYDSCLPPEKGTSSPNQYLTRVQELRPGQWRAVTMSEASTVWDTMGPVPSMWEQAESPSPPAIPLDPGIPPRRHRRLGRAGHRLGHRS